MKRSRDQRLRGETVSIGEQATVAWNKTKVYFPYWRTNRFLFNGVCGDGPPSFHFYHLPLERLNRLRCDVAFSLLVFLCLFLRRDIFVTGFRFGIFVLRSPEFEFVNLNALGQRRRWGVRCYLTNRQGQGKRCCQ